MVLNTIMEVAKNFPNTDKTVTMIDTAEYYTKKKNLGVSFGGQ